MEVEKGPVENPVEDSIVQTSPTDAGVQKENEPSSECPMEVTTETEPILNNPEAADSILSSDGFETKEMSNQDGFTGEKDQQEAKQSDDGPAKNHPGPSKFASEGSYEDQFAKFLSQSRNEEDIDGDCSETDSKSYQPNNGSQAEEALEKERTSLKRKVFGQPIPEESSNSSWYKVSDSKGNYQQDPPIPPDESSNLSLPDNASVVSSNIGDSNMSFQDQGSNIDECSNLSAPDVQAFSGHAPDFDESANMNPPSNQPFLRPDTPSSINADASESTPVKRARRGTLQIAADDASEHGHGLTASDIFEYQWPLEADAEFFILQEQISMYLDIKSFKRKYPDLFRRVCDKQEKDFLRERGVVSETQSDLGLTALRSEDVHELMSKDYPAKYKEFVKVLHEREKQHMVNKLKDYAVHPNLEKDKIVEYTKKAMKSTSDWNRNLLRERKEERQTYFDMQTFTIQYPRCQFRKLESVKTDTTAYPLSLIPGQFQDYYRRYSPEELKYFPLNTAMFDPPKKMDAMARQQQAEEDTESQEDEAVRTGSISESDSEEDSSSSSSDSDEGTQPQEKSGQGEGKPTRKKEKSTSRETSKEKSAEPTVKVEPAECRVCKDEADDKKKGRGKQKVDEELIQCSECKSNGHPSCLDLTEEMVRVIKTYPWQCMDCKTCVECMDPYDEDKMLFCDKCDRGYHTFCVGLKSLPTGHWECRSCSQDSNPVKATPKSTPKSRRGAKKTREANGGKSTPSREIKETPKEKSAKDNGKESK